MSNESKTRYSQKEQEDLLVEYYDQILKGESKPSTEQQKKFLLQLLNTKITVMERKTNQKKRLHFLLRILAMFLSGVSTVILGLKISKGEGLSSNMSNIALVLTAMITFLTSLAVFWDIENYWVRNKIMLNKLKEIRYEYVFFLSGTANPSDKDLKPFLDKLIASLGDEYWEKFLKDVSQKDNPGQTH